MAVKTGTLTPPPAKTSILREFSDTTPSEDDLVLIGRLRTLFSRARQLKRPMHNQWVKNYKILRNRTWISGRADWLPSPEVPEIYPIVCSMVGWITDQRPMTEVQPAAPSNSSWYEFLSGLAWDLQTALFASYQVNCVEREIEKSVWDAAVYGTGFLKTTWDDALAGGLGDISVRRVDPFAIYPDPSAHSFDDADYIFEARRVSTEELDRRFPGAGKYFADGAGIEALDEAPTSTSGGTSSPRSNSGALAPSTTPRWGLPGGTDRGGSGINDGLVTLFECWLREHDIDDSDPEDIKVYDCWRVVVYAGNRILLNERADDLWSHEGHPYDRFVLHETGEFWGLSLVQMLAPSQLAINRILSALQLHIELTGNPVFRESSRSGLQRTKITNKPGQRVTVNEGATADWLQPPQFAQNAPDLLRFYIGEMERISGLSAITRGQSPGGRQAADVLDQMADASFVRIRMALRNLEYAMRGMGNKAASLIVEFYDQPRLVATVGPSGEQSSMILRGQHFYIPTKEGRAPMQYSLLVNAGAQQSTSATSRRNDAATLFAMGALDAQAVLEAFNWPNRQQIIQRIQQAQAAGMFQPPGARQRTQRTQ